MISPKTVFLSEWGYRLEAGKRYGSHPALEFVDVGTIGVWGEGHAIAKRYPMEVLEKHIELHKKAFPNSWIVGQDDWSHTFRFADAPENFPENYAFPIDFSLLNCYKFNRC